MLYALLVLFLSTIKGENVDKIPFMQIQNMDKVAHFGLYFVFTMMILFDFTHYKGKTISWKQIIFYSLVFAISFGGMMELLQEIYSLHRSTDITDFLANSVGAVSAVFCYKYVNGLINKLQAVIIRPGKNYFP